MCGVGKIIDRGLGTATGMRHARALQPHFDAAQCTDQREIVEVAKVADAKHAPGELGQPGAQRHVEVFKDDASQCIGIMRLAIGIGRHHDGGDGTAVLGRIAAQDLEPPAPHGAWR